MAPQRRQSGEKPSRLPFCGAADGGGGSQSTGVTGSSLEQQQKTQRGGAVGCSSTWTVAGSATSTSSLSASSAGLTAHPHHMGPDLWALITLDRPSLGVGCGLAVSTRLQWPLTGVQSTGLRRRRRLLPDAYWAPLAEGGRVLFRVSSSFSSSSLLSSPLSSSLRVPFGCHPAAAAGPYPLMDVIQRCICIALHVVSVYGQF